MERIPVSQTALQELQSLVNETHRLIREVRESGDSRKLAEAENKLKTIQAMMCPFVVFA